MASSAYATFGRAFGSRTVDVFMLQLVAPARPRSQSAPPDMKRNNATRSVSGNGRICSIMSPDSGAALAIVSGVPVKPITQAYPASSNPLRKDQIVCQALVAGH